MATVPKPDPSFFTRHRWGVVTVSALAALVLLGSYVSTRGDGVPVRTARVQRGKIRSVVSTNGKVEPLRDFEAHAPANTTVKRVLVKEGDKVKRGQLLLELDDDAARSQAAHALAQLKSAQADLSAVEQGGTREEVFTLEAQLAKAQSGREAAQRNLDATRHLQQKGAASQGEVREAENHLQRVEVDLGLLQRKLKERYSAPEIAKVAAQKSDAQAAYDAAQAVLRQSNIRAPFDGVVYALPVREGVYVGAGDLLVQAADLSKVLVRSFVDEPDVGRMAPGQKIEVTWDALPGRLWESILSAVPASVKLRGTRNVGEVTCVVDNKDLKLLPNVNVGITIIVAEHANVLTIPREALRQDDGKPYVYQVVDNELRRRDVEISVSNLTQVEVTGLAENTVVALSSTNSKPLRDRLAVKVVQ